MQHLNIASMVKLSRASIFQNAFGAIGFVVVTSLLFQLFDRRDPVKMTYGEISPNPAAAGSYIEVELHFERHRECDGTIYRRIVDSAGVQFEYGASSTVYNHAQRTRGLLAPDLMRSLQLPVALHKGPAFYSPVIVWHCNWMQEVFWPITQQQTPIPFEVTAAPSVK